MDTAPQTRPKALTSTKEKILQAVGDLGIATAEDVTRLLFKKGSKSYVRSLMAQLAGDGEYHYDEYLCRFGMAHAPGNFERYYTLGRRGREYARALGIDPQCWYRPQKASFSFLQHHHALIQFLVALRLFVRLWPEYHLRETRTCFAMAASPPTFTQVVSGQETKVCVIPDAWVYLERVNADSSETRDFPLWIEVDCGTESKAKFQRLVRERINLIRYDGYEAYFGVSSVLFVYLAVGPTTHFRLGRLHTMRQWTAEVLADQHLDDWSAVFRFSTIDEGLYDSLMHFTEPVFYRPDSDELVSLLTTEKQQGETDDNSTTTLDY